MTNLMTASLFPTLIGLVRVLIPLPWIGPLWGWASLVGGILLASFWWGALRAGTFDRRGSNPSSLGELGSEI